MPDHVFQTIADAVVARLAEIDAAATYQPGGVGSAVSYKTTPSTPSHWRVLQNSPWKATDLPAINVRDLGARADSGDVGTTGNHHHAIEFECDIAANSIDDLRNLAGDIYGAIFTDHKWSTAAYRTDWAGFEMDADQADQKIFGGAVRFSVLTKTNRGNPYA